MALPNPWLNVPYVGDVMDLVVNPVPFANLVMYDTFANRPAAGTAGRLFYASDTEVLYRDNGATWDALTSAPVDAGVSAGFVIALDG
jgi:hypothetical protein